MEMPKVTRLSFNQFEVIADLGDEGLKETSEQPE